MLSNVAGGEPVYQPATPPLGARYLTWLWNPDSYAHDMSDEIEQTFAASLDPRWVKEGAEASTLLEMTW